MAQIPVIAANNATVAFDDSVLLHSTTFQAAAGEIWAVTGPNGAGKSTLLRAFLDSRRLTSGSCQIYGEPAQIRSRSQRAKVSALIDPIPIARDLTLQEQLLLVAASWYGKSPESGVQTQQLMARLGLKTLGQRFPHQVSAGQLQLFQLAFTLVRPAHVILLDEPERHLDDSRVETVRDLLIERARLGATLLIATHEPVLTDASHGQVLLG